MKSLMLLLMLMSGAAMAQPRVYHLGLSVGELIHNREPMLPNIEHKDWGTAVKWEIGLSWNKAFWDSIIHYESCYDKICTASWEFSLGVSITQYIDIYWAHKSQHTFDQMNSFRVPDKYPLQDAIMMRINFINENRWVD